MLLEALPDPSREINDAFSKKFSSSIKSEYMLSISVKHKANELKADADEAIPLLCGNEFDEFIVNFNLERDGKYSLILEKKTSNLGMNSGLLLFSKKKL
jgi:hypothetical protein